MRKLRWKQIKSAYEKTYPKNTFRNMISGQCDNNAGIKVAYCKHARCYRCPYYKRRKIESWENNIIVGEPVYSIYKKLKKKKMDWIYPEDAPTLEIIKKEEL